MSTEEEEREEFDIVMHYDCGKQLCHKSTILDGFRHGLYRGWHENGQLAYTVEYEKGIRVSKEVQYDTKGNIIEIIIPENKGSGQMRIIPINSKIIHPNKKGKIVC